MPVLVLLALLLVGSFYSGIEILRRRSPKTRRQRSLREIATELAALGHLNTNGRPFSASSVRSMLATA
jgi:hypothetical protein